MAQQAQNNQQTRPVRPHIAKFNRLMAKENARKLLEQRKSPYEVNQERENQEKKLKKLEEDINRVIENPGLTDAQKKAVAAGTARAWYADLLGAPADLAGMALDYGAEGFKSIMPSKELTGYDFEKELGVDKFQQAMRDPVGGYKHLEEVGEDIGYIPPTTGTDLEEYARLAAGFADPVPLPLTAGVFASNRAKTLPKLSKAKAQDMELKKETPQNIFEKTGFFRGPEGEWRFEISDKDMKINQKFLKTKTDLWGEETIKQGQIQEQNIAYGKLGDAIDHPELFKAYPELKDVYLKFIPPGSDIRGIGGLRGSFKPQGEMVPITNRLDTFEEKLENPLGDKVPEKFAKVIMVVAPTRQRSIQNLEYIIDNAKLDKSLGEKRVALAKSIIEEDGNFQARGVESGQIMLEEAEKTLKKNVPELERLKAGGEPDLTFDIKSTLTHEIQHAIQEIEDLPRGGNQYTAFKETQDAAIEPIYEKAREKYPNLGEAKLQMEKQAYDEKLQDMAMMDDVHYLQQLQKFIMSDKPTSNARFIENSSYSYDISNDYDMRTWLGPRPKKHRKKEYADYLRNKALLYQHLVINKYIPGKKRLRAPADMAQEVSSQRTQNFNDLLGDLLQYTEAKGVATHSDTLSETFQQNYAKAYTAENTSFDPKKIYKNFGGPKTLYPEGKTGWNVGDYEQPNWLALGEKNVKNYVKRLARSADKHAEAAGMQRDIENKLKMLSEKKENWRNEGKDEYVEFYKRLAGEAEARAVQKRLELADIEAGGVGRYDANTTDPGQQEIRDFGIPRLRKDIGKVPTDIYDVPLSELAFTGRRSPAAKTQAKTDAQAIMDNSQWGKKLLENPNAAFWNKAELDRIKTEISYGPEYGTPASAVKKANLKATIREMKKDGWTVEHTSKHNGKVSSYYMNKGGFDGPTIRVSDHELPDTPERQHNRQTSGKSGWDEEVIINSKSSIKEIKNEVNDYLKWFLDV